MLNERGVMMRKKVMLERQKKKNCGRNANHHAFMLSFRREKEEESKGASGHGRLLMSNC